MGTSRSVYVPERVGSGHECTVEVVGECPTSVRVNWVPSS